MSDPEGEDPRSSALATMRSPDGFAAPRTIGPWGSPTLSSPVRRSSRERIVLIGSGRRTRRPRWRHRARLDPTKALEESVGSPAGRRRRFASPAANRTTTSTPRSRPRRRRLPADQSCIEFDADVGRRCVRRQTMATDRSSVEQHQPVLGVRARTVAISSTDARIAKRIDRQRATSHDRSERQTRTAIDDDRLIEQELGRGDRRQGVEVDHVGPDLPTGSHRRDRSIQPEPSRPSGEGVTLTSASNGCRVIRLVRILRCRRCPGSARDAPSTPSASTAVGRQSHRVAPSATDADPATARTREQHLGSVNLHDDHRRQIARREVGDVVAARRLDQ